MATFTMFIEELQSMYFNMVGQQKRRISCWWGNVKCKGYENKDDVKDYCDQFNVARKFFCDSFEDQPRLEWSSDWEEIEKKLDTKGRPRRFK